MVEEKNAKRYEYIEGDITADVARRVCRSLITLAEESKEPITLYIDSSGGDVVPALDIYDILKNSKTPVTGVVVRHANSMAAFILQGCARRLMYRNGEILLHPTSLGRSLDSFVDKEGFLALCVSAKSLDRKATEKAVKGLIMKPERLAKVLAEAVGQLIFIVREISWRTGKKPSAVHRLLGYGNRKSRTFTAQQALKENLVDEIIEKR